MQLSAVQKWIAWAVPNQALPVRLTQRRIYIFPTKSGFFFGILCLAMLVGAVNYSLSLGHALVFLLIGFGLVAMLHSFRNLLGLAVRAQSVQPVFMGESAIFGVLITNHSDRQRMGLCCGLDRYTHNGLDIEAQSDALIQLPVRTSRRGWMNGPRMVVSSLYPVGFFRAWSVIQPNERCLVYPSPIYLPIKKQSRGESSAAAQPGDGQEDFTGLRSRKPSDSFKAVAWKAMARNPAHDALMIKQFDGGSDAACMLDWESVDAQDAETKLSVLCGWVLQAESQGLRYGLQLPKTTIGLGNGPSHRDACLAELALFGRHGE